MKIKINENISLNLEIKQEMSAEEFLGFSEEINRMIKATYKTNIIGFGLRRQRRSYGLIINHFGSGDKFLKWCKNASSDDIKQKANELGITTKSIQQKRWYIKSRSKK